MDSYKWSDRFYQAAESIALAEKTGANIYRFLEDLWPAGLRGNMVHYNNRPFESVSLISAESLADCVIAPPLKNFRFDVDKVWPEDDNDDGSIEQSDSPKRSKKRHQHSDGGFDDDSDSDEDIPKVWLNSH